METEGGFGITGLDDFEKVGVGGFATVYSALQVGLGRRVAVKILTAIDDAGRRRFDRECLSMGRTADHLNIVNPIRAGYTDPGDQPFLVMEYMSQGSLQDRLDANGPLPWPEVIELMLPIADALGYSHDMNVLHRDVKPANILVSATGVVKLCDFGIAAVQAATATSQVAFSMTYTAPETFSVGPNTDGKVSSDPRDERSDLYSLAATIYTLGVGNPPFDSKAPAGLMHQILHDPVPSTGMPSLDEFFAMSMAKDPNDRHPKAAHLIEHLRILNRESLSRPVLVPNLAPNPTSFATGNGDAAPVDGEYTKTNGHSNAGNHIKTGGHIHLDGDDKPGRHSKTGDYFRLDGGNEAQACDKTGVGDRSGKRTENGEGHNSAAGDDRIDLADDSDSDYSETPDAESAEDLKTDGIHIGLDEAEQAEIAGEIELRSPDEGETVSKKAPTPDPEPDSSLSPWEKVWRAWGTFEGKVGGSERALGLAAAACLAVIVLALLGSRSLRGNSDLSDSSAPPPASPTDSTDSETNTVQSESESESGFENLSDYQVPEPETDAVYGGHSGVVTDVAQLADGRIVSAGEDSTVQVWGRSTPEKADAVYHGHIGKVTAVAVLTDGRVASAGEYGTVHLWDPNNPDVGAEIFRGHSGAVLDVVVMTRQGGDRIASAGAEGIVLLWDSNNPDEPGTPFTAHEGAVNAIVELANGYLATGGADTIVRVWNPQNPDGGVVSYKGHESPVDDVVQLTDGRIASADRAETVHVWSPESFGNAKSFIGSSNDRGVVVELPDGRIASGDSGRLNFWAPDTPSSPSGSYRGHDGPVVSMVQLDDGMIASAGTDGKVRIWDPQSMRG